MADECIFTIHAHRHCCGSICCGRLCLVCGFGRFLFRVPGDLGCNCLQTARTRALGWSGRFFIGPTVCGCCVESFCFQFFTLQDQVACVCLDHNVSPVTGSNSRLLRVEQLSRFVLHSRVCHAVVSVPEDGRVFSGLKDENTVGAGMDDRG
ncbi:hypothetical protein BT67DRAFT_261287 [Trichocladium antarcticum]|uniref:Uncharacterized protein n=1 Tax=Trichocladium antarcticum TaxID=1450529 RepID=A0AAN6UMJ6_9PEZI|nr:hypothetical protein BT67DRAFT_261287 [Trichocladium antarcticum]